MKVHDIQLEFKGYMVSIGDETASYPSYNVYLRVAHDDWWLYCFDRFEEVSDLEHEALEKAFQTHLKTKSAQS